MKTGLVSTFGVKCGISTYSTYLGNALTELKDVSVSGFSEYPYPNEKALDDSLKANFPFYNCWRRGEPFTTLIEESQKTDILHIQHQFGLFPTEQYTTELYEKAKQPIVTTLHDVIPPTPMMETYFNSLIKNSKKIIVHNNTCRELLMQWGCPKEKISMIYHGTKLIDVPDKQETRKILGIPENAKVILSWGFIWESKGVLDLVKILAEIKKTYPEAIFIHAGGVHPIIQGSTYLQNIIKTAIKNNLTPKDLTITNWLPEDSVSKYFAVSDVIVLNYMRGSASASGAAHRAMASHRPIVKTDDLCLEEIPGLTVQRFDVNALKDGIVKVLQDETLQNSLAMQADKVAQDTSWCFTAQKHKQVYENL